MNRQPTGSGGSAAACVLLALVLAAPAARAVSARWSYEAAYDNVADGDWYRDANNETATLAWGESYVMMSLASMFRATGDLVYLDRLAHHIEGVLARRDDARGVADYRGVSGACWRNTSYQPAGEPYCYAVHSGMLAYPMAEFARLVAERWLGAEVAPDGETYAAKSSRYLAAARETAAYHDDEWNPAGYYVFRPSAGFLTYAGRDQPLNQSNAMGRLLLALHAVTGEAEYRDKAVALATRLRAQLDVDGAGAYVWNYWGGPYAPFGEDVSHGAINVGFAALAAGQLVTFDDHDVDRFAATFVAHVYVDDGTFSDWVGGGSVNDTSYRPQVGRWVPLASARTTVYAAVRDLFHNDYPPEGIGSGSLLLAWAYLAEFEPPLCPFHFYHVDWDDQGDRREATDYGANILTVPPDFARGCLIPVDVDVPRAVEVQQWDGEAYHRVASWRPTAGFARRHVPYEPRWPFPYSAGAVLWQFADSFVAGDGIVVREPETPELPAITSTPPTAAALELPLEYAATGSGSPPLWWSLPVRPPGARVDAATGLVRWTPSMPGDHSFTLRLENDFGSAEQSFTVTVDGGAADADADADTDTVSDVVGDADADGEASDTTDAEPRPEVLADALDTADARFDAGVASDGDGGCACGVTRRTGRPGVAWLVGLLGCWGWNTTARRRPRGRRQGKWGNG
jgi:hypothetical protein